jgi:hypothetical protein
MNDKMKIKTRSNMRYWMSFICALTISCACRGQSHTFDLTSVEPDMTPSGAALEWHTGLPVSASNTYPTPQTAAPGLYYAVFNYGSDCYSTPSPYRVDKTSCTAPTANLADYADESKVPAGSIVTYHTGAPATDGNRYAGDPAAAAPGKYYLAYRDSVKLCYSYTTPLVILTYEDDPTPQATADSSVNNMLGTSVSVNLLTNDVASSGEAANTSVCTIALTTMELPTGSTLNEDGSVTVPGQGKWIYDAGTGNITFHPQSGFKGNPDRITYTLTDNGCCKIGQAVVAITYLGALPVTLASFEGKLIEQSVHLTWATNEAVNFSHFEIQRSTDAKSFAGIANIPAKESKDSYKFVDNDPAAGTNYYRLKMIDLDRTYAHSRIVAINLTNSLAVVVYPNPVSSVLIVNPVGSSGPVKLSKILLYDQAGRLRNSFDQIKDNKINVSAVTDGLYLVRVVWADGTTYHSRIVVKK